MGGSGCAKAESDSSDSDDDDMIADLENRSVVQRAPVAKSSAKDSERGQVIQTATKTQKQLVPAKKKARTVAPGKGKLLLPPTERGSGSKVHENVQFAGKPTNQQKTVPPTTGEEHCLLSLTRPASKPDVNTERIIDRQHQTKKQPQKQRLQQPPRRRRQVPAVKASTVNVTDQDSESDDDFLALQRELAQSNRALVQKPIIGSLIVLKTKPPTAVADFVSSTQPPLRSEVNTERKTAAQHQTKQPKQPKQQLKQPPKQAPKLQQPKPKPNQGPKQQPKLQRQEPVSQASTASLTDEDSDSSSDDFLALQRELAQSNRTLAD